MQFAVLGEGETPLEIKFRRLQETSRTGSRHHRYDDAVATHLRGRGLFPMPSRTSPVDWPDIAMCYAVPVVSGRRPGEP